MKTGRYLKDELRAYLPPGVLDKLRHAGAIAAELGYSLYLIGGSVRDMLLPEREFDWDIDMVSENTHVDELAVRLHQEWGGILHRYPQYGTATLRLGQLDLDFATARTETYAHPGANPEVCFSDLEADLIRRDFTVNAMALELCPERFGHLIDPFQGQTDLKARQLKALHKRKFLEDPVRSWRAVRLSISLNFELEAETRHLIVEAMESKHFDGFSNGRIRNELYKVLEKQNPSPYLKLLTDLHVLRCLDPELHWNTGLKNYYQQVQQHASHFHQSQRRVVHLIGLLERMNTASLASLLSSLHLPKPERQAWESFRQVETENWHDLKPSQIYERLENLPEASIWALLACSLSSDMHAALMAYWEQWRFVQPEISGKIILEWVQPGPRVREILKAIHHARLDGLVHNLKEEKELAAELARQE